MSKSLVIVTGASKGIGEAVTKLLCEGGCSVIGVARSESKLESLKKELGDKFNYIVGDVIEKDTIDNILKAIENFNYNALFLVNNVGIIDPLKNFMDATDDELKRIFDVNVFSVMSLTRAILPKMLKTQGRIINISSGASTKATYAWGPYSCTKAVINMYSSYLALEFPSIFTLSLRPGVVDTEMQTFIRENGKSSMKPEDHSKFTSLNDEKKLLSPYKPGGIIANLLLCNKPPMEHNGKYLSWDSEELKSFNKE